MKRIVFILILANLFYKCETKKVKAQFKKTEFYYPRVSYFKKDSSLTEIYLDSIKNYGELIKTTEQIACAGKAPLLKFSTDSTEFNLIVYKECTNRMDIVDYHLSNVISIQKDSIIINDEIEMGFDSLQPILRNHILNPNQEFNYSKSVDKALVFYYQDSLVSAKKIKYQLIKITKVFNELNRKNGDSLPLKIKLSEHPYIRILNPPTPDEESK
ncbi:MAG: hypothetical protein CMH44_06650 [Muricauda sp.]|nr:hypothetical protein [Allomuricauda sp.]